MINLISVGLFIVIIVIAFSHLYETVKRFKSHWDIYWSIKKFKRFRKCLKH